MKIFTIQNETNQIAVHASAQDASAVLNSARFRSEASLARLAAGWPSSRLIAIWNNLPDVKQVNRFRDRSTAVSRIWKAVQGLTDSAGGEALQHREAPREGSKTSRVIAMLRRRGGTTVEEIMTAMGWQRHTTRAMLSAGGSLTKKHGLIIKSKKIGDQRKYSAES
jgi:hypothetical protein